MKEEAFDAEKNEPEQESFQGDGLRIAIKVYSRLLHPNDQLQLP
jgi:hypothetical protein